MPDWVDNAYHDYAKRFVSSCRLNLIEVTAGKRTKSADIARIVRDEGERVLAAIPANCGIIALERTGKEQTTAQLAHHLQTWLGDGVDIALLIGGPEGLAQTCINKAAHVWSLSQLTLPHPLVRVILAEQLYRAWSMLNHLPYHRGDA